MRNSPVDYILTAYSASMFGDAASIHQMKISEDAAKMLIGPATQIVATRTPHEQLAKRLFGHDLSVNRFADLTPVPEKSAILIHYRGSPVGDDGVPPEGSTITFYLIESEEYLEPED